MDQIEKDGKIYYGQEARDIKHMNDTRDAYAGAAEAFTGWLQDPSNMMLFAGFVFGGPAMGLLYWFLMSNFSFLWIPDAHLWIGGATVVLAIALKILTNVKGRNFAFISFWGFLAIIAVICGVIWLIFLSGDSYGKSVPAQANVSMFSLYREPSANSTHETRSSSTTNDGVTSYTKMSVIGVTDNGWALVGGLPWNIKNAWTKASMLDIEDGASPRNLRLGRTIPQQLAVFPRKSFNSNFTVGPERNTRVAILGEDKKGFVRIAYLSPHSLSGDWNLNMTYALAEHIAIDGENATPLVAPEGKKATVNYDENIVRNVNMYAHLLFNPATRIRRLDPGTQIVVLGETKEENKVKIWFDGLTGYMYEGRREQIGLSAHPYIHYD